MLFFLKIPSKVPILYIFKIFLIPLGSGLTINNLLGFRSYCIIEGPLDLKKHSISCSYLFFRVEFSQQKKFLVQIPLKYRYPFGQFFFLCGEINTFSFNCGEYFHINLLFLKFFPFFLPGLVFFFKFSTQTFIPRSRRPFYI